MGDLYVFVTSSIKVTKKRNESVCVRMEKGGEKKNIKALKRVEY